MSLIAWYPLNGDLKDNCGGPNIENGLKITETGTEIIEPTWGDGKLGKCYELNSNSIYTNNSEIFIPKLVNKKVISISCWLKQKSNSGLFADWLSFGVKHFNQDFEGYRFRLEASDTTLTKPKFFGNGILTNAGGITTPCANVSIPLGTWIHIVYTFDREKGTAYLNGKLTGYTPYSWSGYEDVVFTGGFILGGGNAGKSPDTNVLNGGISNVKIYDHVLSQEEILQDYKQPMLHYSFENPYAEETTNIPHSITKNAQHTHITLGSDNVGNYFTKSTGAEWWEGIELNNVPVVGGRYYTWSIDVNPSQDIQLIFDHNATFPTSNGSNDFGITRVAGDNADIVPKNTWTRLYQSIYVYPGAGKGVVWSTLCTPSSMTLDSELKVYYRNSLFEEKNHPTPYTSSNREAGLIRDNSGMGNDGTQVYQREKIPIESITPTSAQNLTDTISNGTHTIKGFNGTTNQCIYFGKIKYNPSYHYVGATVCYEFDLKVTDMTTVSGQTPKIYLQGTTNLNDGTSTWYENPICNDDLYKRINNGKNGTYHICLQKKITVAAGVTNVISYGFGVRFDYIKSGTITISNLHAYYGSLDTSTLSITDNSAIGSHSLYLNGKNYINCGVVTPSMMDEFTASIWLYRDDWTIKPMLPLYSSFFGVRDNGGFAIGPNRNIIYLNFEAYYNSIGYLYPNVIDMTKLSTGWHLITGVADKNRIALYLDGELYSENVHNKNAQINMLYGNNTAIARMPIYVGAELENWATTPSFRTMKDYYIDDIRLYATALSDKDIKALYNVKTRIDNKSNLYCNQLVETKSENLASDLSEITECGQFRCTCSTNYDTSNKILTFTLTSNSTEPYAGPYILNKYYGGSLVTNKTYRYSIYVKFSRSGRWKVGEERIINSSSSPFKNGQEYEAGKWYKIENEGVATAAQVNFIFYYSSGLLEAGDKIQVRDFQMHRLYDNENYNPRPNIKGQYKTFELNETFNEDVENSGATIVDKYGAEWLEVFYHNNKSGTILFANETEALHTNSQYKFSILDQLENFRGTDNKFEFLLEYPDDFPNEYNRWKQTDNPVTVSEVIGGDPYKAAGYESVHIDWDSNRTDSSICNTFSGLLRSSRSSTYTLIDGSIGHGNWHTAIGAMSSWNGGVPSPMIQSALGRIKLYVRIDNLPNKNEIFRQYKRQTKTKEIIEI